MEEEELDEQNEELDVADSEELTDDEADFLDEDHLESDNHFLSNDTDFITLPSGRALTLNQAISLTAKRKHKIILFAGAHNCGKTSLISNIFLMFQNAAFKNISFVSSSTLIGFEIKVWDARTASMRETPFTVRTGIKEPPYLHLSIMDEKEKKELNLLLCDISGEKYETAANSNKGCIEIKDFDWIEHFVLILDGKKLASLEDRFVEVERSKQLLYRLFETGKLQSNSLIQIVISKADLPEMMQNGTPEFIQQIKKDITKQLNEKNVLPKFFFASAHYIYGEVRNPFDIHELFNFWVKNSPTIESKVISTQLNLETREIYKFYHREFNNKG